MLRLVFGAALLFTIGTATTASAAPSLATSAVNIQSFTFVPNALTVTAGDTVTWTNKDPASHTVTFDGGGGSSPLTTGATFTFKFTAAGTFAYHCAIHPSMTGSVTVLSASTPVPTAVPTPVVTPAPTAPPTAIPTSASTAVTTTAPATSSAAATTTPAPTTAPAATTAPIATTPGGAPSPTAAARTSPVIAGAQDDGRGAIFIGGGILLLAAFAGTAWSLRRRAPRS